MGGGAKVNSPPPGLLISLKKIFAAFPMAFIAIFLFEDTHKHSILTKFQKFLSKTNFLKKSQNFDFSNKWGKIQNKKKLTTFLKSSYQKNIKYHK